MLDRVSAARSRYSVACLANAINSCKVTLGSNAYIYYFPAVGIELDAGGVVHVAAYQPYVGGATVAWINMGTVTVGTLDVLPLAVVGHFTFVAVGADIDAVGLATAHVGAQQITLR